MNSDMVIPEKFGHLHLVYHFTVPIRLPTGRKILYINCSYAPQSGLSEHGKDNFFFNLLSSISVVPSE